MNDFVKQPVKRETALDLLLWLAQMGQEDREQYREIRALLWDLYAANRRCSEKPSDCC